MNSLAQSTVVPIDNEPAPKIDGGSAASGSVGAKRRVHPISRGEFAHHAIGWIGGTQFVAARRALAHHRFDQSGSTRGGPQSRWRASGAGLAVNALNGQVLSSVGEASSAKKLRQGRRPADLFFLARSSGVIR